MPIKWIHKPFLFLIIAAVMLGIFKTATSRCISNDAVTFLEFSDQLHTNPGTAIRTYDQHPGYPTLVWVAQKCMGLWTENLTLEQQILSGQLVTGICKIITLAVLYRLFGRFGPPKTALIHAFLVLLIPVYAENGGDALSDWPCLMFMATALLLYMDGIRTYKPLCFILSGIASGLAYLIRPEGAFVVIVAGFYFMLHLLQKPRQRVPALKCLLMMILAAALFAAPYMVYKGSLLPKKILNSNRDKTVQAQQTAPVSETIKNSDNALRQPVRCGLLPDIFKGLLRFVDKIANVIYLLIVPISATIYYKLRRFSKLDMHDQVLTIFLVVWFGLLMWLYCYAEYISHRHIMPFVIFSMAWCCKGVALLARRCTRDIDKRRRIASVFIMIAIAVFIPKLIRPAHADKAHYKALGIWLNKNTPQDTRLGVFDNRIGFYAQRTYKIRRRPIEADYFIVRKNSDDAVFLPTNAPKLETGIESVDQAIDIYQLTARRPTPSQ
ncbi:MAG: glycosyltransferase family 39 protein [Anaerohalosphaeraceae bacterium]